MQTFFRHFPRQYNFENIYFFDADFKKEGRFAVVNLFFGFSAVAAAYSANSCLLAGTQASMQARKQSSKRAIKQSRKQSFAVYAAATAENPKKESLLQHIYPYF